MSPSDPQFLYLVMVLPILFGLVLVGEGVNKVIHEEKVGLISIIFGLLFIGLVIVGFLFFSTYLKQRV